MFDGPAEVLLVEDNPHDLELTLHAWRKVGSSARIHVARDGAEALDFLFGGGESTTTGGDPNPRVVLLDLKLPLISGLEVLRTIKSDARTRSIPVVVLTSSKEECDISECYDLGVNSYIVKPVRSEQFTNAVRELASYWLALNQPPQA